MDLYSWLKALHIIAVISWMAGLLYLPRLYVYHSQQPAGSAAAETFKVMERKLLRYIMTPAMIATFLFGGWLVWEMGQGALTQGWLHAKIVLVLVLAGMHGMMGRWRRELEADQRLHSQLFFRIMNEVPTLLMIAIVILAVVKPF